MQIGTPGENWDDSGHWRGHRTTNVKRTYREWVRLHESRDEFQLVMSQYGGELGTDGAVTTRSTDLGLKAFDLAITEVRNDNLIYDLKTMLGMEQEELLGYWFSRMDCSESPFGGCLFVEAPVFGDQCVFCGLHFR
ncbi:hypothetical protein [Paeniglutamicibacter kerguelensis]|uniref:Uncharacterized protein n=1 Tax=Paeniglutamicibacter kerguelensis TaxID=254788 RepID=A0ABS4XE74_9MICC|nr:hypothetical protein [Paeniglutamicibacter kerguelensis]MBP2386777.1 hypothetical protein [Paeniglutamicibacter kerguelensis]